MRRFLTLSFIVLALVTSTTAGLIPVAHADEKDNSDGLADGQTCKKDGECASGTCYGASSGINDNRDLEIKSGTCMSIEDADAIADAAAKKAAEKNDIDMIDKALAWIMVKIMSLFAWLVGVAALVLNYAVYYTVVTMGDYVSKLSAVGVTWSILRDIGNIMLIFGFLAVGISVILNSEWYGGGAKMLPMLLVAAVFINFSLFITEAVIDTSNLFAMQFYKQINEGEMPIPNTSVENEAISNTIMKRIGINGIYNSAKEDKTVLGTGNTFLIGFMSIILFSVTAFVMFTLAFILIARFVILLFLIIIAPIGFAGLAIPQLKGTAGKWWNTLFEQAITAPVLMLLLYIALSVIIDPKFLGFGEEANWTGFTGKGTDIAKFAGTMLSFIVAMGLLLAVVIISKKLSAFGAGAASKTAGKLSFGAMAFAGRHTVGRASSHLARKVSSSSWGGSERGRLIAGGLNRVGKGSFDVRGIKAGGGLNSLGVDAGVAQKGGFKASQDKAIKAREDYAASLKDRKITKEESGALVAAHTKKSDAEKKHTEAVAEHGVVTQEHDKQKAEVERLEKEGAPTAEKFSQLETERSKLADIKTRQEAAAMKSAQAEKDKEKAAKEHTTKVSEINTATSAEGVRKEYGKKLMNRWSSSATLAGEKIIKEKKNTVDLDEMKKWLEEKNKPKEEKGEAEKKPEEKKPESKPETPKS